MEEQSELTTKQKEEILTQRFGNKFFNELGERIIDAQTLKGIRKGEMSSDTLELAKQFTEEIYKKWIEEDNPPSTNLKM